MPELAVRPYPVVFVAVFFNDEPSPSPGPRLLTIESFVSEAPVERLHEAIQPGATRLDVDGLDSVVGDRALGLFGDRVRAFVGADVLGRNVLDNGGLPLDGLRRRTLGPGCPFVYGVPVCAR